MSGTGQGSAAVRGAARLILLRHGRTEWNATGRFQGQADVPLDELGREQAALAAEALAGVPVDEFWASDLSRAVETARAVADPRGMPVRTDPRLREIHVGSWEGMTAEQVREIDPGFGERYARGEDVRRSETGETTTEVAGRVATRLAEVADAAVDGATVLVGIHGLAAVTAACRLIGFGHQWWGRFGPLTNCHWIDLRRAPDGGWRIHAWNAGPDGLVDGERRMRQADGAVRAQ